MSTLKRKTAAVLLVLLGFGALGLIAQRPPGERYIVSQLNARSGLPQDTVYAVAQDHRGYIWFGTDEGLARFDGVDFRTFNKTNTPQLGHNSIRALHTAQNNTLWIGTFGGGVTLYKDGKFSSITTKNGLPNDFIRTIYRDRRDTIWLGTVGGLAWYRDKQVGVLTTADGLAGNIVNAVLEDHKGSLWIGTDKGLNRYRDKKFTLFTAQNGLGDNTVNTLYQDRRGLVWAGTAKGVTLFKDQPIATITTSGGLSGNLVRDILQDAQGNTWIATGGGLCWISAAEPGEKERVLIQPFQPGGSISPMASNALTSLFQDREGNLWAGSSGDGAYMLRKRQLLMVTTAHGLPADHVTALLNQPGPPPAQPPDPFKVVEHKPLFTRKLPPMWIGTRGGLCFIKDGKPTLFTAQTHKGLPGNHILSLSRGPGGPLWVATGQGLCTLKGKTFTPRKLPPGLAAETIRVLFHDRAGNTWIGTLGSGLFRRDKQTGTYRRFTSETGLADDFILCIAQDRQGVIWAGTYRGLNRLNKDTFQTFNPDPAMSADAVYDIYPAGEHTLWLGTNGGGLKRFDLKDHSFFSFTTETGLFTNTVYKIVEDRKKYLWMSSNKGIFSVSLAELDQLVRGVRSFIICNYFNESDGMETAVCGSGYQPAGALSSGGVVWFPTARGAVAIDPSALSVNEVEPSVFIRQFSAAGKERDFRRMIKLPGGTREITIAYTALSFTAPLKVKFRYRLQGYNNNWIETYSRAPLVYRELPAGDYQFQVTACNNDGVWSSGKATVDFSVRPPFLKSFLFYLFIIALLTVGGFYLYRLPEKKRQQKEEEQEKYQTSSLTPPRIRQYASKLQRMMEKEKLYLEPELNAAQLAKKLKISRKHLSQVINQQFQLNVKNFINRYRIEAAKKKLLDPKEQDFVLLKIAMDVGFNSKSVFNEAFKKFTGMSPSQYRKKHGTS